MNKLVKSMKHFPLLLLALLLLSSCGEKELDIDLSVPNDSEAVILTASLGDNPMTRTERTAAGKVRWLTEDAISLFYSSGESGGSKFVSTNTEATSKAYFSGTIGVITGGSDDVAMDNKYFWGLYPYDENSRCDGDYIYTSLPSVQESAPGTFADDLFISLGRSTGLDLTFYNVCSGFGFFVSRDDIQRVTIHGNNGETLTGDLKIGYGEDDRPVVAEVTNGSQSITLTAPDGGCFEPGVFYYAVTIPQTFSAGFTMTFSTGSKAAKFVYDKEYVLERSAFVRKKNADADLEFYDVVPFEDEAFRSYCLSNFDADGDGEISISEAENVEEIIQPYDNEDHVHYNSAPFSGDRHMRPDVIHSLAGIEYFVNLKKLNLRSNSIWPEGASFSFDWTQSDYDRILDEVEGLSELDLSHNTKLEYLDLSANYNLSYINIENCSELKRLRVKDHGGYWTYYMNNGYPLHMRNKLASVNLGGNDKLEEINLEGAGIEQWDLSSCPALKTLILTCAPLKALDVSSNEALEVLYVDCRFADETFSSIDVSNNRALRELDLYDYNAYNNHRMTVDLSQNHELEEFFAPGVIIESLDLSPCPNLCKYLSLYKVSNLVFPDSDKIENLEFDSCEIPAEDIQNFISIQNELKELKLVNLSLTALDISGKVNLKYLVCSNNEQLTSLDVSDNVNLWSLDCSHNQLTSLDVSGDVNLTSLGCSYNQLTSLDVSNNVNLTSLVCSYNQLTSLDVSNNVNLTLLNCGYNQLTVLDVSCNDNLTSLNCNQETLRTLFMNRNQQIEGINVNRNDNYIYPGTVIEYSSSEEVVDDDI